MGWHGAAVAPDEILKAKGSWQAVRAPRLGLIKPLKPLAPQQCAPGSPHPAGAAAAPPAPAGAGSAEGPSRRLGVVPKWHGQLNCPCLFLKLGETKSSVALESCLNEAEGSEGVPTGLLQSLSWCSLGSLLCLQPLCSFVVLFNSSTPRHSLMKFRDSLTPPHHS